MEIWKQVNDYKGYYEVSNYGNVRSIPHKVNTKGNKHRVVRSRVLIQKTTKEKRKCVILSKEGRTKTFFVHRLVAFAFCDGWFEGAVVNHKDENPSNNNASNLEWCTQSYNCGYGHHNDTNKALLSIPINAYDITQKLVYAFHSIHEASRSMNISATHICQCCKGKRKSAGGYFWKYAEQ